MHVPTYRLRMKTKRVTKSACAACKHQRRRCSKQCPLSRYFPADKPNTFGNAHRLFGVGNIMRILKQVEPEEKDDAMRSIIYESDMRARNPVQGCLGVLLKYKYLTRKAMEELRYVKKLLALYKENSQHGLPNQPIIPPSLFEMPTTIDDAIPICNYLQHNNDEFSFCDANGAYVAGGSAYSESDDHYNLIKTFGDQQSYSNVNAPQFNFRAMQDNPAGYDTPLLDEIADGQSFVKCKDARESRAESSFKYATQHIQRVSKNELECSSVLIANECRRINRLAVLVSK